MAWTKRTGIMLCQPLDERNLERNFKECPQMLVQPKLDGQRCWVHWQVSDKGKLSAYEPILFSSQGNIITGVPHINIALKELAYITDMHQSWDGELYVHKMEFEEIVSRTKRLPENLHEDYLSIQYHIFDMKTGEANAYRQQNINHAFDLWNERADWDIRGVLQKVPTFVADRPKIEKYLDQFIYEGYEGIIIRNPIASYVEKRPYTILKWKPSKTDYYQIVEVEEAISEDGEHLNKVGALVCTDRFGNKFKVGTGLGLDDSKRTQLWRDQDYLINKWACVHYQNLTKYGVPRFGKFTKIVISEQNKEKEIW